LNLKPWEFSRLQPHEFNSLLDGYICRKESNENTIAYFAAHLINTQLKEPISAKTLLEPIREVDLEEKKKDDEDYLKEKFKGIL
jgi:hypothetical protein